MKKLFLALCFLALVFSGSMTMASENQGTTNPKDGGKEMMMGKGMMKQGMMKQGMMKDGMMGKGMMCKEMMGQFKPGTPQYENYKKFLQENRQLLEELNGKRAELMAIYMSKKPDPKKVGELAREITKLEGQLQDSAFKYNLPDPCPWMIKGSMPMSGKMMMMRK